VERREHIATLLKNSLTSDDLEHLQKKRLLALLRELNDLEVLILRANASRSFAERHRFEQVHPAVAQLPSVFNASASAHDRTAVHESYLLHMSGLGLLQPRYQMPMRGEIPEFDPDTGTLRTVGYQTSRLGKLLLRMLDLEPEIEAA
jgi:hypothetical protein